MKILKYIFYVLVWGVVALYLTVVILFSIPAVQQYLGGKAAGMLAEKLGTSVSIQRLDYSLFSHVTLYGVSVKDQQGREMLRSSRVSARLELIPLAEGRISIATAQLFGTHAKLCQQDSISKPNYQFLLDSLTSRDTTSTPLDLRINSLIMRHSSVSYDRYDIPETAGRLNPAHLQLKDISAHLVLKVLTKDSINFNLKRLSLREKSGLDIKRLTVRFEGGRKASELKEFRLHMPGTDFQLGDIAANYRMVGDSLDIASLVYEGSIQPSTFTLADLSSLLPSLSEFHSTLSIATDFHGTGPDLQVNSLEVGSTTGDININCNGWAKQLDTPAPIWTVNLNDLQLSAKTVNFISENLKGKRLEVPEMVRRLGSIHMNGFVNGTGLDEVKTYSTLTTDAGSMALDFELDKNRQFKGNLDTKGINLGQIFDDKNLGQLATEIALEGEIPADGEVTVKADGQIGLFTYNGYDYKNIGVSGQYGSKDTHGRLTIDDPNLTLNIEGKVERTKKMNNVKLTAEVSKFSPLHTHISSKWGDAIMAGTIVADFSGNSLTDAVGTLDVNHFSMHTDSVDYRLQNLSITTGYESQRHRIYMSSDFGRAEITGNFDYATLPQSFVNLLAKKIPTLPGLPKAGKATDNDFTLNAYIRKSDWLQYLLQVPVRLEKPMTIYGNINDRNQQVAIECNAPQFYYKDDRYDRCHISVISPINTLAYEVSVTKLMDEGKLMDVSATGTAYNNHLSASLSWDDHSKEQMSGRVTAQVSFETELDGQPTAHIHVAPSQVTIMNTPWNIKPCFIEYRDKHIDINGFTIEHNRQHLKLNGTVSESNSDSLQIDMSDIDVDYVLGLVDFDAVSFGGRASGGGFVRSVLGDLEADARLTVSQFTFENGRMGTLNANVIWNKEYEQIDIHAIADDGTDAKTYINGYVSPKRNFINLSIEAAGTYLDFAQSFTESFISHIDGHADGAVTLAGTLDNINITGQLVLNGNAHVRTLGCTYQMRSDTLKLRPDEIEFSRCPVYDIYGNRGIMTGGIHHKHLTSLTYDIYVDAQNLLAYNFQDFGDDMFYGTVFADGRVGIHGRESSLLIEADVTPRQGTVFVYNASSPDAINNQEFIEWGASHDAHQHEGTPAVQQPIAQQEEVARGLSYFRSDLNMRLKINANPQAAIRLLMDANTGDYITLKGTGDLQANYYNKGGLTMFGTYRVSEGTYGLTIQDIIKKNFIFKEGGTVVFGGDPYDASLNLQAQHTVNGVSLSDLNVGKSFSNTVRVNCLMNISGQPRQPVIDFDLNIPSVSSDEQQMVRSIINGEEEMNQQVIYLLAVGRFYPQQNNNATEDNNGQSKTSLAMQSLLSGTISGQINNVLGQLVKNDNWNFGANISTGDEGWNNAEYEGIINGRLLNNRLLINGQFGYRDNATTATPSFIGDFDISYLLLPNGNLALKVYNQTNDRYFTRSSLNTQGIGIIMKKDFTGIRDLFGIKKRKKTITTTKTKKDKKQNKDNNDKKKE